MPEQLVRPQEEIESDQQTTIQTMLGCKGDIYENNRYRSFGRIQCRN